MVTPLVIDTDAGIDDAIAILLALASPAHKVAAITCVSGNVHVDQVICNVPIVLDAVRADGIPIFRGAERPLHGEHFHAARIHGRDGLGDAGFRPSDRPIQQEQAVDALIRMARVDPGGYSLVTLGPLTNLALAITREPALPRMLRCITVMGGAVRGRGNVTATAEFNVYADPEAAAIVFQRVPELTLLPWEVCLENLVPFEHWDQLTDAGALGRRFVRPMTARLCNLLRRQGLSGMSLPDPLAMAVTLDEGLAKTRRMRVDVDMGRGPTKGMTVAVEERRGDLPANTRVVTSVDRERFLDLLKRTLAQECGL